jgi:hypothetical protein
VGSSLDRVKPKTMNLVFFLFSAKHTALRRKTGWLGIRIMCSSRVTCLA